MDSSDLNQTLTPSGPSEDSSVLSISTLAASVGVPHIPHGGQDARLSESLLNPFTSVIYPRIVDLNSALARFLLAHGRTNYIAALFAYTDAGIQVQEGIEIALDLIGVTQRQSFGYISPIRPAPIPGQSIPEVVQKIKASGYRTIVVTMDNDVYDLANIADAAEECGLNSEEYLWIFLPPFTVDSVQALIE
jgi:AraC-like DNA-binding protein